ncbi:MAG: phenylacetate--CoA ligase [Syntrophobacteraceae bacterium]
MAWNDRFECMPVEELQKFQFAKLKETVSWLYERIPFYRRKLDESGVRADDLKSVDDITKLPFTEKNDLRDNYPFGLCAVPMNEVVRIHCSSGTTGKPITGPYTAEDVEQWTECVARVLWAATVRKEDIVQVAYGYGLFTGGLGLHQGASRIGCAIVPTSSGMTERQVMLMKDFGATALFCTPSYALTIAERAEEMKMPIRDLPLRVGVFGAEPWTRAMRDEIDERMGISARDIYGLTELGGPGMAYDCDERNGLHINEDHFLAETIDPVTLEPVPPGQRGELVLTAIQRRAMPLLRYRTKDITTFSRQPCSCGRTFVKMDRITGRTDDMLIINGVNVFPSQIEALLSDIKEIELQYLLIVRKKKHLDELNIRVEGKKEVFDAGPGKVAEVERKIVDHIRGMLGIHVGMEMVRPKALKRSEGKAVRVVDERPKN